MLTLSPHGSVVAITGASSGIGLHTAFLLCSMGFHVYGGSRRGVLSPDINPKDFIPDGETRGGFFHMFALDVTSDDSAEAFLMKILEREPGVDILINAAGNGLSGAVEDCTAEDARAQMDTNYFGALRMQAIMLPGMRARGRGLVINVGSVGGIFPIPYQTLYASSKAALGIMTEGLRLELRPYGVHAALLEPGDVKTGFTAARAYTKKALGESSPYRAAMIKSIGRMERDEENGMPPNTVALAIARTVRRKNPPARQAVGGSYRIFVFLKRLLPARLVETLLHGMYCK